jgi:hypothetical protein
MALIFAIHAVKNVLTQRLIIHQLELYRPGRHGPNNATDNQHSFVVKNGELYEQATKG